ncbi:unnamed protein product, partial [Staurois parvus]
MQLPILGCTFLTLSDRPLIISALMIGAQQCHPSVPPTCAQQCHLPVPSSATHLCPPTCSHQCHPPVP